MVKEVHEHPLVRHHLTVLRDVRTGASAFRRSCAALTRVVVAEAVKDLPLERFEVETPLETTEGWRIGGPIVFVPILRAGLGMLEPAMETVPGSSVGYIGMERDEATAEASCYYAKMPDLESAGRIYLLDPMLATGGSAAQCVDQLKQRGAKEIAMICIVAAPEGIALMQETHPDVDIVTAAVDRQLNEKKYILPGLGDFGDRLFNT
jgi:uracil phosphoribosyltransferase